MWLSRRAAGGAFLEADTLLLSRPLFPPLLQVRRTEGMRTVTGGGAGGRSSVSVSDGSLSGGGGSSGGSSVISVDTAASDSPPAAAAALGAGGGGRGKGLSLLHPLADDEAYAVDVTMRGVVPALIPGLDDELDAGGAAAAAGGGAGTLPSSSWRMPGLASQLSFDLDPRLGHSSSGSASDSPGGATPSPFSGGPAGPASGGGGGASSDDDDLLFNGLLRTTYGDLSGELSRDLDIDVDVLAAQVRWRMWGEGVEGVSVSLARGTGMCA